MVCLLILLFDGGLDALNVAPCLDALARSLNSDRCSLMFKALITCSVFDTCWSLMGKSEVMYRLAKMVFPIFFPFVVSVNLFVRRACLRACVMNCGATASLLLRYISTLL